MNISTNFLIVLTIITLGGFVKAFATDSTAITPPNITPATSRGYILATGITPASHQGETHPITVTTGKNCDANTQAKVLLAVNSAWGHNWGRENMNVFTATLSKPLQYNNGVFTFTIWSYMASAGRNREAYISTYWILYCEPT